MSRLLLVLTLFLFGAVRPGLAEEPALWALAEMDGTPFVGRAVLDLSDPARITGQGPCNRFFADLSGDRPDFLPGPIGATRMACPELAAESAFLDALQSMTRAEIGEGPVLVLTGPGHKGGGQKMLFRPDLP